MQRFLRIQNLLGQERFGLLTQKKVVVVGLGAVGSYAVEGLARSGIGHLRLVDFDRVNVTNINRQLYALESTLGKSKAGVAVNRVKDINPKCHVEGLEIFAHFDTMSQIVDNDPDLVIDAIDSLNPKANLLAYCYHNNIPVISSMGAALRTDPLKIRIGDVFEVRNCPLGRHLRKRLKNQGVGRGISCVYSIESVPDPDESSEFYPPNDPQYDRGRQRKAMGSLPTLTGLFGLILANMAIERLSKLQ